MGRIPIVMALSSRGINLPSNSCCQCGLGDETSNHVLVQCQFVKTVLKWVFSRCKIPLVNFQSATDVLDYASSRGNCSKKKKRFLAICDETIWSVWKARNNIIQQQKGVCH